ncbi:hypothetical protein G8770_20315 [Aestuariicella hydrocarbonica]|uniref:Shikimate kinase n=2 Tax=Pseudomaricurvus hydrocarbonicus TaxID=1470433 RepID=A0A9E5MPE2_9GAMM|nr:hypothetical protein [Aestuariicella hydrocarbonica]
MTMSNAASAGGTPVPWFKIFKYCVYAFLIVNLFFFFMEDWAASAHLFSNGISFSQLIEAYAATIDTAAWVVLLLIFELETSVISDTRLKGNLKWLLNGLKGICYLVIVYACYGYLSKYIIVHAFEPSALTDLCAQAAHNLSFMTDLDEYESIAAANCADLSAASAFYQLPGTGIVTDTEALQSAQWLSLIDVVNSANWLLIVVILTMDVWLQLTGKLTGNIIKVTTAFKVVLYFILLLCAVFWGIDGDFLDFWDAFLWILAFALIELNLFEWHAESEGKHTVLGDSDKIAH